MTRSIFRPLATVAAFAAATAAMAPAAFAQPVALEARSKVVNYGDLDLNTAQGQALLEARLRRAANAVCDITGGPQPLAETLNEQRCFNDALSAARASYAMARQQPSMAR
ncbi:UrcA family protein [Novosphingobium huizhouense]|uniref:UrcA family protein n=1 Tax=Novosphingobium huizhouense TaxID=2866625 RepID=UPI001CD87F94|nr:UrcA family protein [Novosphingobium huizhouense]